MIQTKPNMGNEQKSKQVIIKGIGIGLISLGWEIAIPIFGGVLIGYYLDKLFNTSYVFKLSLLGHGIFIGYYNIYKRINFEMLRKKFNDEQKYKNHETK